MVLAHRRTGVLTVLAILTGVAMGIGAPSPGQASPQSDLKAVQAKVRELRSQAESANENYYEVRANLSDVRTEIDSINAKIARNKAARREQAQAVNSLARSLYMMGSIDPTLQILLAEDPSAFLAQASAMEQLSQSQQSTLRKWQTAGLALAQSEAVLADRERAAKTLSRSMADRKSEVDDKVRQAESVLGSLSAEQRRILAAQRAQQRQQQAAQAAAAAKQINSQSGASGGGGSPGSGRAAAAVRYALSQVGDPYSYSANPPQSWDCSKLTTAAWGQSGVGITPLSYRQWDQTRRVPVSQIRPGDLVFYFGKGAHHVAMYIGNGKMVSASNPDDGVEIIDFLGPWYRERFSGVGRVIG
ncbi:MAG: C40 family peptidase [Actinobacteria bacterium]|nr:C40 family peptidase [Actinomycetota bacterium]